MQSPEVVRRYGDVGIVGVGSSPQELDRFWREQLAYLGKIIKNADLKPVGGGTASAPAGRTSA